MFNINIGPGIMVSMLGFFGLVITLAENTKEIGSKIPLALFFLLIIIIGLVAERYASQRNSDVYGEFSNGSGFG